MSQEVAHHLEQQIDDLARQLEAVRIENAQLVNGLRSEIARREALENVVAQISSELDLDKALQSIIRGAMSLMGDATKLAGVVSLVDRQQQRLFVKAEVNTREPWLHYGFIPGEGLHGQVWKRAEPVILDSYDDLPEAVPPEKLSTRGPSIGVPVVWQGTVIGVFTIISLDYQRRFTPDDASLMLLFAKHAAIAIENARLYAQSQEYAIVEERNRLARELHDTVTQMLYSMTLTSRAAKNFLTKKPERVPAQLDSLEELSRQALAEMRALLLQLRPRELEDESLLIALRRLLNEIGNRHNFVTRFEVRTGRLSEGETAVALPDPLTPKQEQAIYRIAQEGLANIIKHACASTVEMTLDYTLRQGQICFRLEDDGVGLAASASRNMSPGSLASGGFGLDGIRQRVQQLGGTVEIADRLDGKGTSLIIFLPLTEH